MEYSVRNGLVKPKALRVPVVLSFGLRDKKGREIGAKLCFNEVEFRDISAEEVAALPKYPAYPLPVGQCLSERQPAGHSFAVYIIALRGGKEFGALQPWNYFQSEAERDVYIAKRLAAMKKRYEQQIAKGKV